MHARDSAGVLGPGFCASPACGFAAHSIITRIGKDPIGSLDDFRKAAQQVEKGQVVRLSVTRYNNGNEENRFIFFEAE